MCSKFNEGSFLQAQKRYREGTIEILTGIRVILKVSTHFLMQIAADYGLYQYPG